MLTKLDTPKVIPDETNWSDIHQRNADAGKEIIIEEAYWENL